MDLFLAISQGIGASLAAGVRAAVSAAASSGCSRARTRASISSGTDFAFLESIPWWLALMAGRAS